MCLGITGRTFSAASSLLEYATTWCLFSAFIPGLILIMTLPTNENKQSMREHSIRLARQRAYWHTTTAADYDDQARLLHIQVPP